MTEQQRRAMLSGQWFPVRLKNSRFWGVKRLVDGQFQTDGMYGTEKAAQKAADRLNRKGGAA